MAAAACTLQATACALGRRPPLSSALGATLMRRCRRSRPPSRASISVPLAELDARMRELGRVSWQHVARDRWRHCRAPRAADPLASGISHSLRTRSATGSWPAQANRHRRLRGKHSASCSASRPAATALDRPRRPRSAPDLARPTGVAPLMPPGWRRLSARPVACRRGQLGAMQFGAIQPGLVARMSSCLAACSHACTGPQF